MRIIYLVLLTLAALFILANASGFWDYIESKFSANSESKKRKRRKRILRDTSRFLGLDDR